MDFKKVAPNRTYSYKELKSIARAMREELKSLKKEKQAMSIVEFFSLHKDLEKRLRETSILGYPSNVVFTSKNICSGLCNQTTLLFACESGIENLKVATALDKEIASYGYKAYLKDWRIAHHTWVEFEIDGKEFVLDFTDQVAMEKQTYYNLKRINDYDVMKQGLAKLYLEQLVDVSFVEIGRRICEMISTPYKLLYSYDEIIDYNLVNRDSDYEEFEYLEKELEYVKKKLLNRGFSREYISNAFILTDAINFNKDYDNLAKITMKEYIKENIQGVFDRCFDFEYKKSYKDNAILKEVFPQTKEMYKRIYDLYQGPRENFDKTYENLGL